MFCLYLLEERTPGPEEIAEAEGGPVAQAVAELRVPRVDQELNLRAITLKGPVLTQI